MMKGVTFLVCLILLMSVVLGISLSNSEVLKPYTGPELGRQLAIQNDVAREQARIELEHQASLNAEQLRALEQADLNSALLGRAVILVAAFALTVMVIGLTVVAVFRFTHADRIELLRVETARVRAFEAQARTALAARYVKRAAPRPALPPAASTWSLGLDKNYAPNIPRRTVVMERRSGEPMGIISTQETRL